MNENDEIEFEEYHWRNGWGHSVATMRISDTQPNGIQFWFQPPENGWLNFHLILIDSGDFVCRISKVPNNFLDELVDALLGVLNGNSTSARSHGEPISFDFSFDPLNIDSNEIEFSLGCVENFSSDKDEADSVLGFSGDFIVQTFCGALLDFVEEVSPDKYKKQMSWEFPLEKLQQLKEECGFEPNGQAAT